MARYNQKLPKMFDEVAFDNMMKKHCPDLTPEKIAHIEEDEKLNAFIEKQLDWEYQIQEMTDYILKEEFRNEFPHSIGSVSETRDILIEHNAWTPEMQKIYDKVQKEWGNQ